MTPGYQCPMRRRWVGIILLSVVSGFANAQEQPPAETTPADQGPSQQELDGARHRLRLFEAKVERANGQPMKLDHDANDALKRIKSLKQAYPDHPAVEEMFQQARKLLILSKGDAVDITPDMLAYRQREQALKKTFADIAAKEWEALKTSLDTDNAVIQKAFPAPSPQEVSIDTLRGKYVILEDFDYPRNEFRDMRQQWNYVGDGKKGFYFVELSGREWIGAYEAFKRYRRFVNRDIPEDAKWTLLGRITSVQLLVPQAEKKKTRSATWGWGVEPVALYVPGCTVAVFDAESEEGGHFAGEGDMEKIKQAGYTVTEIPDDVTPERLVEIYVTAIKEKNYPLYLECIDPNRRRTPTGLGLCMYHWELHQERFATFYCHVEVQEATISVLKGFDAGSGNVEDFFLDEADKQNIAKHAEPLVEQAELKTKAYDERGRQYGSPKPRFLKRTEKKRWYIVNYPQPF